MQSTPQFPHTLAEFAWLSLAAFIGYFIKHLPSLFRRRTPAEEKKTEAEARQIDGSMMVKLMEASAQAVLDVAQLRREKEFQFARAEAEKARADLAEQQLDRRIRIGDGEDL